MLALFTNFIKFVRVPPVFHSDKDAAMTIKLKKADLSIKSFSIQRTRKREKKIQKISGSPLEVIENIDVLILKLSSIKKNYSHIIFEIGFGNGAHTSHKAFNNAEALFIGCEPYYGGIYHLAKLTKEQSINNIFVFPGDARPLLARLADSDILLDEIHLLFPDPWPKTKHFKRRIINSKTLELFSQTMRKNGRLLIATDHVDYGKWMMRYINQHDTFTYKSGDKILEIEDCKIVPRDWISTKYEKKAKALGKEIIYFDLYKK